MNTTRKTAASPQALSLPQRVQALELQRHAGRLAEIKAMHARLVLLEAFLPAIEAAGLSIAWDILHTGGGKSLWLHTGVLDHLGTAHLVNVLVANGMVVVERNDYAGSSTVHLKKGRLQVSTLVDHRAVHLLEVPACV